MREDFHQQPGTEEDAVEQLQLSGLDQYLVKLRAGFLQEKAPHQAQCPGQAEDSQPTAGLRQMWPQGYQEWQQQEQGIELLCIVSAEMVAEGQFACLSVTLKVAVVVDQQHGRSHQANTRGNHEGGEGDNEGLKVVAARDGRQPEKKENKQFSASAVGDGAWSAGIGEARRQGEQADDDDGPAPNQAR